MINHLAFYLGKRRAATFLWPCWFFIVIHWTVHWFAASISENSQLKRSACTLIPHFSANLAKIFKNVNSKYERNESYFLILGKSMYKLSILTDKMGVRRGPKDEAPRKLFSPPKSLWVGWKTWLIASHMPMGSVLCQWWSRNWLGYGRAFHVWTIARKITVSLI